MCDTTKGGNEGFTLTIINVVASALVLSHILFSCFTGPIRNMVLLHNQLIKKEGFRIHYVCWSHNTNTITALIWFSFRGWRSIQILNLKVKVEILQVLNPKCYLSKSTEVLSAKCVYYHSILYCFLSLINTCKSILMLGLGLVFISVEPILYHLGRLMHHII